MSFFDKPIINSPYDPPDRHWELDLEGHPTDVIIDQRRGSALWTALPGWLQRQSPRRSRA